VVSLSVVVITIFASFNNTIIIRKNLREKKAVQSKSHLSTRKVIYKYVIIQTFTVLQHF
jgi:hypothetical protein